MWGTLFSCFDCTFAHFRKKVNALPSLLYKFLIFPFSQEDVWNAIFSGAATGGLLAARAGLKASGKSALVGGVILAAIEGLNIVVTRLAMPFMEQKQLEAGHQIDYLDPPVDPMRPYVKRTSLLADLNSSPASVIYNTPVSTGSYTAPTMTGFDIDSLSTSDSGVDDWQRMQEMKEEERKRAEEEAAASKPFWKVW